MAVLGILLTSCGAKKPAVKPGADEAMLENIIARHQESEPDFKTLYARLRGTYDDGYEEQSISVSLRMQKNDTIWLSAKLFGLIPLAKALITPTHVKYYDKINHVYFDGDFRLLSHWLGTDLNFEKVQDLLIGQAIDDLNQKDFVLKASLANGYQIAKKNDNLLKEEFLIDGDNFRLAGQQLTRKLQKQSVTITYPAYGEQEGVVFPKKIDIRINQKEENTKINIDYRSLEFNRPASFPFKIPSGYKEIDLQ